MRNSRALKAALFAASIIGLGAVRADAACIGGGVVDNIADCVQADSGSTDCLLAWSVNYDGLGGPPPDPKTISCVDGDPCDRDGHANGVCTFEIGACVNATVGGCTTATLSALELQKPAQKDVDKKSFKDPEAYYTRRTLLNEIGALLPASGEACTSAGLELRVPSRRTRVSAIARPPRSARTTKTATTTASRPSRRTKPS